MLLTTEDQPIFGVVHTYTHIDLTLVSPEIQQHISWDVDIDPRSSDHMPIHLTFINYIQCEIFRRPKYILTNLDCIQNIEFVLDITRNTIDDIYQHIKCSITQIADNNFGKTSHISQKPPVCWWSAEIAKVIRKRKNSLRKFNKYPTDENFKAYIECKNSAITAIRNAKTRSFENYVSSIDTNTTPSQMWKKIRSLSGKVSNPNISELKHNGMILHNKADIANNLAEYYKQMSSNEHFTAESLVQKQRLNIENERRLMCENDPGIVEYNSPILINELKHALENCKGSSPGDDNISYKFYTSMNVLQLDYLLKFFNKIFQLGKLPKEWKTGIIIPVPKPNQPQNLCSSYRPITLTICLSKIFEKIISKRLYHILESEKLIYQHQYAFRKQFSTQDALLDIVTRARSAISSKEQMVAVFLDLKQAYNCTWPEKVISQLIKWNIKGNILKIIEDFLLQRKYKVLIGNTLSESFVTDNGVPQGSVLSVIIFLVAVNNIHEFVPSPVNLIMFADDATILMRHKDANKTNSYLQIVLRNLERWGESNGFILSESKSRVMNFTNKNKPFTPNLKLHGNLIKNESNVRYLGMELDRKLKWNQHINNVILKCRQRENIMKMLSNTYWGASFKCLKNIYTAMLRSVIDYGDVLYITTSKTNLKKLDSIQNRAMRVITGTFPTTPIVSLQALTGLPELQLRRDMHLSTVQHKINRNPRHALKNKLNCTFLQDYINHADDELNLEHEYEISVENLYESPP